MIGSKVGLLLRTDDDLRFVHGAVHTGSPDLSHQHRNGHVCDAEALQPS